MPERQVRAKVIQWPSNAGEGSPAYKPTSPCEELRSYRYQGRNDAKGARKASKREESPCLFWEGGMIFQELECYPF